MMCQLRFLSCNKHTTVKEDVDYGEEYACMESEEIWENLCTSTSVKFAVNAKLL